MRKYIAMLLVAIILTACGKAEETNLPSDDEIIEKFYAAQEMQMKSTTFFNSGNGGWKTENGTTPKQYRESFSVYFTDKYISNFFNLYGYEPSMIGEEKIMWFSLSEESVQYCIDTYDRKAEDYPKLTIDDLSSFEEYDQIWIGGTQRGDDISIFANELKITEKTDEQIKLVMYVMHSVPPDYEAKINRDYVYDFVEGQLIIRGKFGGFDENNGVIIIEDELTGTISEGDEHCFIKEYEYTMINDNGNWKLTDFPIWY